MPGLFGFTKQNEISHGLKKIDHLNLYTHEKFHDRNDFRNNLFSLANIIFDFQEDYPTHYVSDNLEIWLYGDPLIENLQGKEAFVKVLEIIIENYPNFNKLSSVDGLFNIVIFDKTESKLFIINDRNGLAHLFYGVFNHQLVWGSELRAFISKYLDLTIEKQNIYDFLNLGYLVNNDTWFKEVKLLPPATVLKWDFHTSSIDTSEYWSHKLLDKNSIRKSKNEVIKDLKTLFENAVKKRVGKDERVGITLSGGLDSRLIYANIPFRENGFTALTRGMKNAGDLKLAKKVVANRIDCNHIIKIIDGNNWIEGRRKAAEATSGQKSFFDMNAVSSLYLHKQFFDINLDGAGGDGILVGGHLKFDKSKKLSQDLKKYYFKHIFIQSDKTIKKLAQYHQLIESDQYFYIHERVRRFTVFGSILGHDYGIITRFPFLDHELQEYFYQLESSTNLRKEYLEMLIRFFPNYYVDIDCLDTGSRLFSNPTFNLMAKIKNRLFEKIGIVKYNRKYHNYPKWLRENNRDLVDKYILDDQLYLYKLINFDQIKVLGSEYLDNGVNATLISRLLSLNIFFEDYKYKVQSHKESKV